MASSVRITLSGSGQDFNDVESVKFSDVSSESVNVGDNFQAPEGAICNVKQKPAVNASGSSSSTTVGDHIVRILTAGAALKRKDPSDMNLLVNDLPKLGVTEFNAWGAARLQTIRRPVVPYVRREGMAAAPRVSLHNVVTGDQPVVEVKFKGSNILQVDISCICEAGILEKIRQVLDVKDADMRYSEISRRGRVLSMHLCFKRESLVPQAGEEERLKQTLLEIINSGDF